MMTNPGKYVALTRTVHRRRVFLALLTAVIALPLGARDAFSQEPDKGAAASTAVKAIRRATEAYREAVENGDVEAAAKFWTSEADYVDHLGHAFKIQAALEAAKNGAQDGGRIARPPLKIETLAIRLISPDVAMEDGIIERAVAVEDQQAKGRYCAVWVKRGSEWLIDGVRESAYSPVTSSNHFEGLEWMVGEWVAEGPDAKAEVSCSWGPKKCYLLRQIKFTPKKAETISATQWIGWDPVRERVRSFEFDSLGGFREGVWTKDGDAWVVAITGAAPGGRRVAATNVYSRVDDKTATWEMVDDEMDGQPGSDIQLRATRKTQGK